MKRTPILILAMLAWTTFATVAQTLRLTEPTARGPSVGRARAARAVWPSWDFHTNPARPARAQAAWSSAPVPQRGTDDGPGCT